MGDPLVIPYSNAILIRLIEKGGKSKKSDIIMKDESWTTWSKSMEKLSSMGYLKIEEKLEGRRTYEISLTDKGRQVAEQLKNAELASQGRLVKSFFSKPQQVLIFLGRVGRATVSQIKEEIPGSYEDLDELKKMNLITSKIEEKNGTMENFVMLTDKGEEALRKFKELEEIVKG